MYKNFLKNYVIFCLIILVVGGTLTTLLADPEVQMGVLGNFLIFFVLTLLSTVLLINVLSKNSDNFQLFTLASIFVKMIFAVIYFYFVFRTFKNNLLIFVGSFFLSYLLFTIFEVSFLVRFLLKKTDN